MGSTPEQWDAEGYHMVQMQTCLDRLSAGDGSIERTEEIANAGEFD